MNQRQRLSSPGGLVRLRRLGEAVTVWLGIVALGAVLLLGLLLLLALSALVFAGALAVGVVWLLVVLLRGWPPHGDTKPWKSSR